jgi:hypothetical protein
LAVFQQLAESRQLALLDELSNEYGFGSIDSDGQYI